MDRFFLFWFLIFIQSISLALPLEKIKLPAGFKIEIYASPVTDARSLTMSDSGTLFVGTRKKGNLYAITPDKKVITLATDLDMPNGVAFHDGNLYVALRSKILRYDQIEKHLTKLPPPKIIYEDLPTESHHGWRYLRIGPDNKLYLGVGAPCNVCLEKDPKYASIMRMNLDGSGVEIYAHGVRNTLGFTWQPKNNAFWFTDNGRDWLGDDVPPDELNVVHTPGKHYGFPFCYGKNIADMDFDNKANCQDKIPSVYNLPAHVAALGISFYTGAMFPENYHNNLLVAYHGSWNRTIPDGYRITRFKIDNNTVTPQGDFAFGWLQEGKPWGRPVDLLVYKDGSLLVSDDHAGVIYRIFYKAK